MNEFVTRKLGEVLAFTEVSKDTFELGRPAIESLLGPERVVEIMEENARHAEEIKRLTADTEVIEPVAVSSINMAARLREIRELYVAGEWDKPVKLLEWFGFFEGAASVHWALVKGAAQTLDKESLTQLAEVGEKFHRGVLDRACELLQRSGAKNAGA